ncbi:PH and SEC7 domain-containing protein 1 [Austrofundulus limnaeus]|uniref:PH and SEC7 domain-containing protein 1-like n=1 Tax=Austrofundulus limnaeus TaxID=52670 RepID=A0A2I4AUH7_AUSLI|nr:PREDICTED: PH and SEC7 domain-containing protein 1-like [Austrofundulus limnaeus]XP_013859142.1 PREDICTED: PH and SEC7 domain-containing protein 1-like [Austrofundulus limnaeus]XP_013859143.1 PREDICTED: PH and SEC7 domain-containing protein 1-like [Austrofundulus limnaeus]
MEEENACSSMPDCVEAALPQPEQECRTSTGQQSINGAKEVMVWGETQVQMRFRDEPKAGDVSEEAEEGEETWSAQTFTCTSPPISVATVEWDMHDSCTETSLLMTDSSLANELDFTSLISTSPSFHWLQEADVELLEQWGKEEPDDAELLSSTVACSGNDTQTCDSADVKEPKTQEKEDSTHEQPDTDDAKTVLKQDGERPLESAVVATEDFTETAEDIRCSGDAVEDFIDLKPEEEQEVSVLLTEQDDSEVEQTSASCVEDNEENEDSSEVQEQQSVTNGFNEEEETSAKDDEDEEKSVTNVYNEEESDEAKSVTFLKTAEVPAEPKTDTGLNVATDQPLDLEEPELLDDHLHSGEEREVWIPVQLHKDLDVQPEELEMCEDVDQNVDPEQSEAVNNQEAPTQEAENSPEREEVTENLEEMNCSEQTASQDILQLENFDSEQQTAEKPAKDSDSLGQSLLTEQITCASENPEQPGDPDQPAQTASVETEITRLQEPAGPSELDEQSSQPTLPEKNESDASEQLSETETEEAELNPSDKPEGMSDQAADVVATDDGDIQKVVANGGQHETSDPAAPFMNGGEVDREKARKLAERLFNLDNVERADVVKHIDKDNDFSRAVGEEYLQFFDFTGQTLDQALRSFLKVVVLIGESQERERVLQHFSNRFHQGNPDSFSSPGAVLALTCAVMLLNTDLHGQLVGKAMSSSKFVSNLDGMNEGENFNKDLLKSLYNSIKSEPLEWAVDEEELKNLVDENDGDNMSLRSKANPFQDVPHDKKATVVKEGFLQRKIHADINGKRTPWGKRGWKMFYGVLKGMVLYLQKNDYPRDQMNSEEVVSVHHCLAERASDYTKKPHVFRLQTADWRVFLFQASSKMEMNSWINRINFISALHSSPPFAAAVGSQRRFFRPILPCSQSAFSLDRQQQFHRGMLESFTADLSNQQQNAPDAKKAKTKDLEEHRVRTEYLHHEMCRYGIYIQMLEIWNSLRKTDNSALSSTNLTLFDKAVCADALWEDEEVEGGLKKSHSSPSLELETAIPVVKVKRNISERRTYRKKIVPRWNKEV